VREAGTPAEQSALELRYNEAKRAAVKKGARSEFANFAASVQSTSGVVVCMPASVARDLANDPRQIYSNYDGLVGAGLRRVVSLDNDRLRRGVDGIIHGSIAAEIRCGVLSLTTEGLPTYGDVCCRLKSVTIKDRVSFLETNSYAFVRIHKLIAGDPIPTGFRSTWENRHKLAAAKVGPSLIPRSGKAEWQRLLVRTDGVNRANDEFIEAHIFGGFNLHAIEVMEGFKKGRSKKDPAVIDIAIALERFRKNKSNK